MKTTNTILAVAILAAASLCSAQPGGGPPGGGPGGGPGGRGGPGQMGGPRSGMMLLQMSTVQSELKLTAEQIEKINAFRPPQGGPGQGPRNQGGPPGGEPGNQRPPQGPPPEGRGDDPLASILSESQASRLKQLTLQFDAPMTMLDRNVAEQLELTQEQRESIHQAIQSNMPRPEPGAERPTFSQSQAMKAKALNAVMALLTSTQKQKWSAMTGPAFTKWVEPARK